MDIVSSAKAVREHFTSLRTKCVARTAPAHTDDRSSPTQLIILEPLLDHLSSLPILKPASEMRKGLATPNRERRVSIKHGLEWVLGKVIGLIEQEGAASRQGMVGLIFRYQQRG